MTAIGIDTHKATLAACAVDRLGLALGERTFRNDPAGHRALAVWPTEVAAGGPIGIEGSSIYGAALARFLVTAGLPVREVPPQLTRRSRTESRRPGKSDPGDALTIARVTAREPALPPVRLADRTRELGLLLDTRETLVHEATRRRNRLHAHLQVLVPGYGERIDRLVSGAALDRAKRLRHERQFRLPRDGTATRDDGEQLRLNGRSRRPHACEPAGSGAVHDRSPSA